MVSAHFIDWRSTEAHLYINKRDPRFEQLKVNLRGLPFEAGHIWLPSSGTSSSGEFKLYAISKKSFLIAAGAANSFLMCSRNDIWLNVLPLHHVGGLSIFARAFLTQSKAFNYSTEQWAADQFHRWVMESKATITSLVPTQVFDLVQFGKKAPSSLRAIIVGGAKLDFSLYTKARGLGFPLLPSFGMTECASQIATASVATISQSQYGKVKTEPKLIKLSHVELSSSENNRLRIKSDALFSKMALWNANLNSWTILKRVGEWYSTQDQASLEILKEGTTILTPLGRMAQQIKVSGELVNMLELEQRFKEFIVSKWPNLNLGEFTLIANPNARLGHEVAICVNVDSFANAIDIIKSFNQIVSPVERIRAAYYLSSFNKSELGKIRLSELSDKIGI